MYKCIIVFDSYVILMKLLRNSISYNADTSVTSSAQITCMSKAAIRFTLTTLSIYSLHYVCIDLSADSAVSVSRIATSKRSKTNLKDVLCNMMLHKTSLL